MAPEPVLAQELLAAPQRSSDGVYQVSWSAAGEVVLEESRDGDFADPRVVYRGTDRATTVSGREDGVYFYRLRSSSLAAEPPVVQVVVEHHPLSRALGFFALGLGVFAATVALVLRGPETAAPETGA